MTAASRFVAMLGPFGVSIITARALGPEDRGLYFLIISYAQIASQIGNLGLHSSNTYLLAANPERLGGILANSIAVSFIAGPVAALPIVWWFGLQTEAPLMVVSMTFILAPLLILFLLVANMAVALGLITLFNILTLFSGFTLLAVTGLVAILSLEIEYYLMAAVFGSAIANVLGLLSLLPHCNWRFRLEWGLFQGGVGYSMRAYFATLAGFMLNRVGVLVLQSSEGLAEVGYFSIAQQITDALILLPSTVGMLLKPTLIRMQEQSDRVSAMRKAVYLLGGTMAVTLIAFAYFVPLLIPLVYGPEYDPASVIVLWFLPSVLLMSIIIIVSQFLSAEGFPLLQVVIWFCALILHFMLTLFLIPVWGAIGIAVSYSICCLFVLLCLLILASKRIREPLSP